MEAQIKNVNMLQDWVKGYAIRADECSLKFHQKIFASHTGYKQKHTTAYTTVS